LSKLVSDVSVPDKFDYFLTQFAYNLVFPDRVHWPFCDQ